MRLVLAIFLLLISGISIAQNYQSWNIKFRFDKSEILPQELPKIEEAIELIRLEKFSHLRIYGYADTIGDESYNENLSKQRTEEVYQFIKNKVSIDPESVYYEWLGEFYDTYDLHFDEAQGQTKSVDIVVYFE